MRHLHTFLLATELGSFTRAAAALGVTQAAVSQQVAALEKELSTLLFQRTGRAVTPTEAGRQLYDYARRIVDLATEARNAITGTQTVVDGVSKVAASTVPSEWLLPDLLVPFQRLYPQVQTLVRVSESASAIRAVELSEADVGVVGELPRATSLQVQAIARDELSLVIAPHHALVAARTMTLEELCREPLIVREANSGSRRCVEEALSRADVSPDQLNTCLEVNSNKAIRALVERGVAVAFLSTRAISRDIEDRRLVPIKMEGVVAQRCLYAIADPQRLPTLAARAFLEFLGAWQTREGGTNIGSGN